MYLITDDYGTRQRAGGSVRWQVIDRQTRAVVGTYSTAKRARHARDKKDLEYGAVRYMVREVAV